MKRLISLLLALMVLATLLGCGAVGYPGGRQDTDETLATFVLLEDETTAGAEDESAADALTVTEDGQYNSKEEVALYIHLFGHLPSNYITKGEAQALGWGGGSLEPYAPGCAIGGNSFGNFEGLLPTAPGRTYTECDIDTIGKSSRGAKRIVFSNDGLVYYTEDHYESFELLYGEVSE